MSTLFKSLNSLHWLCLLIAGVSALFFFAFTIYVKLDLFTGMDFDLTAKIQYRVPHGLDPQFVWLGSFISFWITLPLLCAFLIIYPPYLIQKISIFGFFGIFHVIELIGKELLHQPNPPMLFYRAHENDFPDWYVHPGSSYPSGHSFRVAYLSIVFILFVFQRKSLPFIFKVLLSLPPIIFSAVILVSRVSLGEHWSSDVIAGTSMAICFGSLTAFLVLLPEEFYKRFSLLK